MTNEWLYRVKMRDGSVRENLTFEEANQVVDNNQEKWACVQPMGYGSDLDPENATRRKAWGM
jgi:hypothetical protein